MKQTVYHGTSDEAAQSILQENAFRPSIGNKEWLGRGIYFFMDEKDALKWAQDRYPYTTAVLSAEVQCKEDECVDLDSAYGKRLFESVKNTSIAVAAIRHVPIENHSPQENQCKLCNDIWDWFPEFKIMCGTFATEPTDRQFRTLTDTRTFRREMCLRDNSCISSVRLHVPTH